MCVGVLLRVLGAEETSHRSGFVRHETLRENRVLNEICRWRMESSDSVGMLNKRTSSAEQSRPRSNPTAMSSATHPIAHLPAKAPLGSGGFRSQGILISRGWSSAKRAWAKAPSFYK